MEFIDSVSTPRPWEEEKYLKPALEDDLLLQFGRASFNFNLRAIFIRKINNAIGCDLED